MFICIKMWSAVCARFFAQKCKASSRNMDKLRKKLAELQAQLMLASPNLVFRIGQKNGRKYTFFLSSKFECSQWQEAISALQAHGEIVSPMISILVNILSICQILSYLQLQSVLT